MNSNIKTKTIQAIKSKELVNRMHDNVKRVLDKAVNVYRETRSPDDYLRIRGIPVSSFAIEKSASVFIFDSDQSASYLVTRVLVTLRSDNSFILEYNNIIKFQEIDPESNDLLPSTYEEIVVDESDSGLAIDIDYATMLSKNIITPCDRVVGFSNDQSVLDEILIAFSNAIKDIEKDLTENVLDEDEPYELSVDSYDIKDSDHFVFLNNGVSTIKNEAYKITAISKTGNIEIYYVLLKTVFKPVVDGSILAITFDYGIYPDSYIMQARFTNQDCD